MSPCTSKHTFIEDRRIQQRRMQMKCRPLLQTFAKRGEASTVRSEGSRLKEPLKISTFARQGVALTASQVTCSLSISSAYLAY
jgi:hypothetical protein